MKKITSTVLCFVLLLCTVCAFSANAGAANAPAVTHNFPTSMKIGQTLPNLKMTYTGLPANTCVTFTELNYSYLPPFYGEDAFRNDMFAFGGLGGPPDHMTDANGSCTLSFPMDRMFSVVAVRAGTYSFKPGYALWDVETDRAGKFTNVGSKAVTLKIEDPIVTTNAPSEVSVGKTVQLTTALTNTALKNMAIADYDKMAKVHAPDGSPGNTESIVMMPVYFRPSITVLEGADLIARANGDYTKTLSSSESITFQKTGTVKLKITYTKNLLGVSYTTNHFDPLQTDDGRNAEKIVTIKVTDQASVPPASTPATDAPTAAPGVTDTSDVTDNTAATETPETTLPSADSQSVVLTDEASGVKLGAAEGVLPQDATLKAEPISEGEVFLRVQEALQDVSEKFYVYDITLHSGEAAVQPNGKVLVTLPIPADYNKDNLAVYYVADDGAKTEFSCTVDGDSVTFETDHFSTYVLAEKTAEAPASHLGLILGIVGAVLASAGAGVAVYFVKFRKKNEA